MRLCKWKTTLYSHLKSLYSTLNTIKSQKNEEARRKRWCQSLVFSLYLLKSQSELTKNHTVTSQCWFLIEKPSSNIFPHDSSAISELTCSWPSVNNCFLDFLLVLMMSPWLLKVSLHCITVLCFGGSREVGDNLASSPDQVSLFLSQVLLIS